MPAQVLFVSKPVIEPFNDGSKCLVRDVSSSLTRYVPRIMVPRGAELAIREDRLARVYGGSGTYRPALGDNAKVLFWLLTHSHESIWHFVFAPNPRTSQVAKGLRLLRRVPMVQTVASPPRSFDAPARLLFGDVIVAQSEWTRQRFLRAFADTGCRHVPRIEVIAPCVAPVERPTDERRRAVRARLGITESQPVLVYPGDLEVSHGAQWVAAAVPTLTQHIPNVCVVFAYRNKTRTAAERAEQLCEQLPSSSVRFIAEVPDIHALLALANGVLFPVDDLFGKVDIPIVLLEAMHLGTPVVALDSGPLADLQGVLRVPAGDTVALVALCTRLINESTFRQECATKQHEAIERNHRPAQAGSRYETIYDDLSKRVGGSERGSNRAGPTKSTIGA